MKKTWKKILAAGCALSMLMTVPGMTVLADEVQEEAILSVAEAPEEVDNVAKAPYELVDMAEEPDCDMPDADDQTEVSDEAAPDAEAELIEEITDSSNDTEKTVGTEDITVGDGVTADFDEETGAVVFYSNGGTLRPDWIDEAGIDRDSITSIRVASGTVFLPADSRGKDEDENPHLFGCLENMTVLDLAGFDTSNVTNMNSMFDNCSGLTELDLSGFITSNVTDMNSMFAYCTQLTELNVSGFDTQNVTDMGGMFYECRGLEELVLGEFDTKNVTDMGLMFYNCYSLTELDVSTFDTAKAEDMCAMFFNCCKLTELDVSRFDTTSAKLMAGMFNQCSNLTELDVSSFVTSNVTEMFLMFADCTNLIELDVSGFITSAVTDMSSMFSGCSSLTKLDLSGFDTSADTDMSSMFSGCRKLTKVDLSGFKTSAVTDMSSMFSGCSSLTKLDLSGFKTSAVTDLSSMFSGCSSLTNLNMNGFVTSGVVDMERMFYGCKKLTELDLSSFNMSNVQYYEGTLSGCTALSILKTPKTNSLTIGLPLTMYDESGKAYTKLPKLTKSITLTKDKPAVKGFTDVQDPTHAYYKAIYWAADRGITKGYPDGTFGINRSCTRGEMIMFLWRYAGKPTPKTVSKSPFKDVQKTHAFYKAILWASQKGITKGYPDGTFGINRNVSRGESMMFLWRLKGKPAPKAVAKSPFKDVATTHAFYKAILWGYQKKVTTGYTSGAKKGKFGINENCTRGQIVTFLYRAK